MTTDDTLLIRAFDAGDTYMSFRWLDQPDAPVVHRVTADARDRCLAMLNRALIAETDEAAGAEPVRAAVLGLFSQLESELALATELGSLLLPGEVLRKLLARAEHCPIRARIIPSKLLARVPFELLAVDGDRRLIEVADLCYEPPAAIHVRRARIPEPWQAESTGRPVLYVIDPHVNEASGLQRILSHDEFQGSVTNTDLFVRRMANRATTRHSGVGEVISRRDLSSALQSGPRRFVYFGHASSTIDEPGSASLHLSDDAAEWGLAEVVNQAHRPLSALDLFLGTEYPHLGPRGAATLRHKARGHQLWPMPARVALIACESGVDFRSSETFGLVTAMFHAGAQVVTSTRWVLPSDAAFTMYAGITDIPGPTTELALAVDETHEQDDPVRALAEWQRHKLRIWQSDPGPATSPLTWATIVCNVCEPRRVRPSRQITRDRIDMVESLSWPMTKHHRAAADERFPDDDNAEGDADIDDSPRADVDDRFARWEQRWDELDARSEAANDSGDRQAIGSAYAVLADHLVDVGAAEDVIGLLLIAYDAYHGVDRGAAIRCLIAAGLVALDDGEYDEAQDLFEAANEESTQFQDSALMAITGNYLGVTAIQTGEYHVAESSLQAAMTILLPNNSKDLTDLLADIRINRANVDRLIGRRGRAELHLRTELEQVPPETLVAAKCAASLGFLYADNVQYADALALLEEARSAFENLGAADDATDCEIVPAHVRALNDDIDGAIRSTLDLRELLVADDRPDKVAYCDYNLANLYGLSHKFTDADDAYDRALRGLADTGQHHRIPYLLRNRSQRLLLEAKTHPQYQNALTQDALDISIVALIVLSHKRFQFPDARRRSDWSGAFAELLTPIFEMAFDFGGDDLVADLIESGINEGVYGHTHGVRPNGPIQYPMAAAPIVRRGGHRDVAITLGAAAALLTSAALPLTSPPPRTHRRHRPHPVPPPPRPRGDHRPRSDRYSRQQPRGPAVVGPTVVSTQILVPDRCSRTLVRKRIFR